MIFCCKEMEEHLRGQEVHIKYNPKFNEYGIDCSDDASVIVLNYCPWCGKKLPQSLRDKWFEELQALGYESPLFDDTIPDEYKTQQWWKKK